MSDDDTHSDETAQDEIGPRFDDFPADDKSTDDVEPESPDEAEGTTEPDESAVSESPDNSGNSGDAGATGSESSSTSKPGPDRDEDATRHKKQVPMYLPKEKADKINELHKRLDAKSTLAENGEIEKHADFMEEIVDFVAENEDELAARFGIDE